MAGPGISVSNQASMSVGSSSQYRGKKVVSASSGKTTSSARRWWALLEQRDEPLDDLSAGLVPGDRAELSGGYCQFSGHSSSLVMKRFPGRVGAGGSAGMSSSSARRTSICSRMSAPATRCSGRVYSAGLWLMPPTLGTKIMPAGHTRASI